MEDSAAGGLGTPLPLSDLLPNVLRSDGMNYLEMQDDGDTTGGTSESMKPIKRLAIATAVALLFCVGEFVGGYFAGSLAIQTDAAHLLSDVAAFLVSIAAICLARSKASTVYSFGLRRAESIGALFSVLIIWVVTGVLIFEAVQRLSELLTDPDKKVIDGRLMFCVSGIGVLINILLMCILGGDHGHSHAGGHGHSHGHGPGHAHASASHGHANAGNSHCAEHGHAHASANHGHVHTPASAEHGHAHGSDSDCADHGHTLHTHAGSSHGSAPRPPSPGASTPQENINVRAAYIHAVGDLVQSIGVMIAGALIWYGSDHLGNGRFQFADPICTFVFAILVLYTTKQVFADVIRTLMLARPVDLDTVALRHALLEIDGVVAVHNLHCFTVSDSMPVAMVHLECGANDLGAASGVLRAAQNVLGSYGIAHTTVQLETAACRMTRPL